MKAGHEQAGAIILAGSDGERKLLDLLCSRQTVILPL